MIPFEMVGGLVVVWWLVQVVVVVWVLLTLRDIRDSLESIDTVQREMWVWQRDRPEDFGAGHRPAAAPGSEVVDGGFDGTAQ